jgi:tetratricopeptide (TPR) repeat protein
MRIAPLILIATLTIFAQEQPDIDQLQKSARAAYSKGKYAEARTELEQAWELAQQIPANDPKRYDLLKQLSGVLSAAGDYTAAQNYVELAINWRETAVSREDPKLADEWIELAGLCQRQKDYDRALALLQRAQMTHSRENGPESLPVADDLSRIALAYMEQQKPELSAPPLQSAIAIREKVLGAEHPAILSELDRLGAAWIALREYAKAEDAFRRALVIRERLVGPTDAGLISSLEGLSYAQFGQKKYEEAEPNYLRLLSLWKVSTGDPAHPMVAMTLDKIAVFYRKQERWEDGTRAAEDANALRELFLANGLSQEATARQAHGDKKSAAKLFAQALGVLDESRPEHTDLRAQLEKNLEELQIEVKPARRSVGKKSSDKY